jgi:hypothetical protein
MIQSSSGPTEALIERTLDAPLLAKAGATSGMAGLGSGVANEGLLFELHPHRKPAKYAVVSIAITVAKACTLLKFVFILRFVLQLTVLL